MAVEGEGSEMSVPLRVGPGDCFMISGRRELLIGGDLSFAPQDTKDVFANVGGDGFVRLGTDAEFCVIGGG